MVSFDLIFRLMLIKDIVEDEGSLFTEGSILWVSINRYYYHRKSLQFVDVAFFTFAVASWGGGVLLGGLSEHLERLVAFLCVLRKQISKHKKQDCVQTYFLLTIDNSVR